MFSYKYIFCAGKLYIFRDSILFLLCVIERTKYERAKRAIGVHKERMPSEARLNILLI